MKLCVDVQKDAFDVSENTLMLMTIVDSDEHMLVHKCRGGRN